MRATQLAPVVVAQGIVVVFVAPTVVFQVNHLLAEHVRTHNTPHAGYVSQRLDTAVDLPRLSGFGAIITSAKLYQGLVCCLDE